MQHTFKSIYPYLHLFINYQGWIELGADEHSNSWVRVLDEGEIRIECDKDSLDESLVEAEAWAKEWMTEYYPKEVEEMKR